MDDQGGHRGNRGATSDSDDDGLVDDFELKRDVDVVEDSFGADRRLATDPRPSAKAVSTPKDIRSMIEHLRALVPSTAGSPRVNDKGDGFADGFDQRFADAWNEPAVQDYLARRDEIYGKKSSDPRVALVQNTCFDMIVASGVGPESIDNFMDRVYDTTNKKDCDLHDFSSQLYDVLCENATPKNKQGIENVARAQLPHLFSSASPE